MPIITNGLVVYYNAKKDATASVWKNLAPGKTDKYHASMFNTPLSAEAYSFNGVNSYGSMPILSNELTDIVEYEVYINSPFDSTRADTQTVLGAVVTSPSKLYMIAVLSNGSGMVTNGGVTMARTLAKNTLIKINTVINRSTDNELIYINDVLVHNGKATNNTDLAMPSEMSFTIGAVFLEAVGRYMNLYKGRIHSIKIYNRQLTAEERSQNSTNGLEVGLDQTPTPTPKPLEGSSLSLSTAGSTITRSRGIKSSTASKSVTSATVSRKTEWSGSTAEKSATKATITKSVNLYASEVMESTAKADMDMTANLSAHVSIKSTAEASMSKYKSTRLAGSAEGASKATASMSKSTHINSSSIAKSSAEGKLSARRRIETRVDQSFAVQAVMVRERRLQASEETPIKVSGGITRSVALSGASSSESEARLTSSASDKPLSGHVIAESKAEGILIVSKPLSGSITTESKAQATVHVSRGLDSRAFSKSGADGVISRAVKLKGTSVASSEATASTGRNSSLEGMSLTKTSATVKVARKRQVKGELTSRSVAEARINKRYGFMSAVHMYTTAEAFLANVSYLKGSSAQESKVRDTPIYKTSYFDGTSLSVSSAKADTSKTIPLEGKSETSQSVNAYISFFTATHIITIELQGAYRLAEQLKGIRRIKEGVEASRTIQTYAEGKRSLLVRKEAVKTMRAELRGLLK